MATPNLAYAYGTTPSTGGIAAILQALKSMFLGVSTTIAAAITATGTQAVTVGAPTNIGVGTALWINWGLADQECVSVTAVSGTSVTANFTKTHGTNSTVTCGLPTLGVTSPWSLVNYADGTNISFVVQSSANTPDGFASYIPIAFAPSNPTASPPTGLGIGTADDWDGSGSNLAPQNPSAYTKGSAPGTCYVNLQDASFTWWAVVCEYGFVLSCHIGTGYPGICGGTLRRIGQLSNSGVGLTTAAVTSGALSIPVDRNLVNNLQVGQTIWMYNNSHLSTSTNWNKYNGAEKLTISAITSTTITLSAGTLHAYDTGAIIGAPTQNFTSVGGVNSMDAQTCYLTRNNDGTWTSVTGQYGGIDNSVLGTSGTYSSPTAGGNVAWLGEADFIIYQNSSTAWQGACGFPYGFQAFSDTSTASEDVFYDGGLVWKAFLGVSKAYALGPLVNPQNTVSTPTAWQP